VDWSKVKTTLICFLLVIDALLAAVFVFRLSEVRKEEQKAAENAVQTMKKFGIEVSAELLLKHTESIYPMESERDTELEYETFGRLISGAQMEEQGRGIYIFRGHRGGGKISNAGLFEIKLTDYTVTFPENIRNQVFADMGIALEDTFSAGTKGELTKVEGRQLISGVQVFNCNYYIEVRENTVDFSGRLLLGETYISSEIGSKSAATVLIAFASGMGNKGVKSVEDMRLGYAAELVAPGYTALKPYWEIHTNAGKWYVDALSLDVKEHIN
jgi:hypothetical protein